ncbi:MAG: sensor histidine kinase [Gammaproteobacteria bacterium]|nr:MAG: sensor histidine kinase [Gammaproteobacteria bacterium]
MLKNPFFKYSFFILLLVNISYTLGLTFLGKASFNIGNAEASAIWFVTFYWLPVWTAAVIILTLRQKSINNTLLEWFITVLCMALGNTVTDNLLSLLFSQYPKMGGFVVLNAMLWGSVIYFITRYIETKKNISNEKHFRKQAQLATLRYQLNPHFMFNSLNTISAYIHTKPDLADEVLHELADILRYSLDTADQQRISLQQEITIIKKYLNIEKARFGNKLSVTFNISPTLTDVHIPPLLLQPIIENSLKHNMEQEKLTIKVTIMPISSGIEITINDNGKGFSQQILAQGFNDGIGMKNLSQRIAQLKNGKISLANNNGAEIKLEMAL